jgi:hypothetical protein
MIDLRRLADPGLLFPPGRAVRRCAWWMPGRAAPGASPARR